mmetsp:Transcript_21166/g.53252  ORF Transcript_21166/g.53252 Transcript_21166/m.53252 type:complete len:341 (-) Transcript_21166:92-1114(-)
MTALFGVEVRRSIATTEPEQVVVQGERLLCIVAVSRATQLRGYRTRLSLPHLSQTTVFDALSQVEGEEKLLSLLTVKIGPYADKEKMLYHLRITRGRVPWAVNSYFRATCAISDNTRRDFEPSPFAYRPEPASNMELIADVPCSQGETVHTSVQSLTSISCLPLQVLEEILRQATPRSVCALAQTCRSLRSASQSNLVWRQLYVRQWGIPPSNSVLSSERWADCAGNGEKMEQEPPGTMRRLFLERVSFEMDMRCLNCGMLKVVPLIYGFPSHQLVQHMHAKQLMLGGDYISDGDSHMGSPCWCCMSCDIKYTRYPHAPPPEPLAEGLHTDARLSSNPLR